MNQTIAVWEKRKDERRTKRAGRREKSKLRYATGFGK